MDIIVAQRLSEVSYDKTVVCEIIDDTKREKGIYGVTYNNTAKFDAYSTDTTLRKGHNVYVLIPMGNWNQQKIITGRKLDQADEPYAYKRPFSNLIDVTGNLIITDTGFKNRCSLIANDNKLLSTVLWSYNTPSINQKQGEFFSGFTRLGIKASFKTTMNPFITDLGLQSVVIQGEYGLRLRVDELEEKTKENEEDVYITHYVYLNQEDMNGSIYDFNVFFQQEKVVDISDLNKIVSMTLEFYQVPGTFKDIAGNEIPVNNGDIFNPNNRFNIFVKDVEISLGYDVNSVEDEQLNIYTESGITYSNTDLSDSNYKHIFARWIHKNVDDTLSVVAERDDLDFEFRWYRYKLGAQSVDDYSGVFWQHLSTQKIDGTIDIIDQTLKEYNDEHPNYPKLPGFLSTWLIPNFNLQNEKVKAVLIYNNKAYHSNILEFTNQNEILNTSTIEAVQALSLKCDDKTDGIYKIYDSTNMLMDITQAQVKRTLSPYFLPHSQDSSSVASLLTEADSIEWIVPAKNTMIVLDDESKSGAEVSEDGFYHIKRWGSKPGSIEGVNSLEYRISGFYMQNLSNNTIQCKVEKGGIVYTAMKSFQFGPSGTSGVAATLILEFMDGEAAVTLGSEKANRVIVRLFDDQGNEVDPKEFRSKVQWSWKTKNSNLKDNVIGFTDDLLYIVEEREDNIICELKTVEGAVIGPNYHILQATVVGWGQYDLTAYLPIPIRSRDDIAYMSGTTKITYSSSGELYEFFKVYYNLYNRLGEKIENIDWTYGGKADDLLNYYNIVNPLEGELSYTPIIYQENIYKAEKDEDGKLVLDRVEYSLQPVNFYVDGYCEYVCVIAREKVEEDKYNILWSHPILITQNKYTQATLNAWDGSLKVDSDKNVIYSAQMIAGKKNNDSNTFTGVVIGEYKEDQESSTGIFGFKNGAQVFGFQDDGTAFFGSPKNGRILISGESSTIQSQSYISAKKGMLLDLDDGVIELSNEKGEKVTIDSTATDFPIVVNNSFKINWNGDSFINGKLTVTGTITSQGKNTGDEIWTLDGTGIPSFKEINITGGSVAQCPVTSTTISSSNFSVENKTGWQLNKNGNIILNSIKVADKTAVSSATVEIDKSLVGASENIKLEFTQGILTAGSNITISNPLPSGGNVGDVLVMTKNGPAWQAPTTK